MNINIYYLILFNLKKVLVLKYILIIYYNTFSILGNCRSTGRPGRASALRPAGSSRIEVFFLILFIIYLYIYYYEVPTKIIGPH